MHSYSDKAYAGREVMSNYPFNEYTSQLFVDLNHDLSLDRQIDR